MAITSYYNLLCFPPPSGIVTTNSSDTYQVPNITLYPRVMNFEFKVCHPGNILSDPFTHPLLP